MTTTSPVFDILQKALLRQYMSVHDMLGAAMDACPERLWHARVWPASIDVYAISEFWYVAFHALFWHDLYLDGTLDGFAPPAPFTRDELNAEITVPQKPYTRAELHIYLDYCRAKTVKRIGALTPETATQRSTLRWLPCSYYEVQLYNIRHLQDHCAQLNVFLGQAAGVDAKWIMLAKSPASA
jgi:hypothetical protein